MPEIDPVMQMRVRYNIAAADGAKLSQEVFNTIYKLGPAEPLK